MMTLDRTRTVLFVCVGNSARSQMAEAWLRHLAAERGMEIDSLSAGTEPKGLHPLTIRAMGEVGIDVSGQTSKHLRDILARRTVHDAIMVCAPAQAACPVLYPFALRVQHWPFDDPAAAEGSLEEQLEAFRTVRDQIRERIEEWLTNEA